MYVSFLVVTPASDKVLFKRELKASCVSLPIASIVEVLHLLFNGVPHEIRIIYQYSIL